MITCTWNGTVGKLVTVSLDAELSVAVEGEGADPAEPSCLFTCSAKSPRSEERRVGKEC